MRFVLFFLSITISTLNAQTSRVVCYWQGIISARDIDPQICSHIIFAFIGVRGTGEIFHLTSDTDQKLLSLVNLKQQNKELKVMAAIGGANDEFSKAFSQMASSSERREAFVVNVLNFLKKHSLSGIDIDWEYPSALDKTNFISLLRDLEKALKPQDLILSIAAAPDKWRAEQFYDIPEISKIVDFINLMTYDFHGAWDSNVGHHAPMFPHLKDSSYFKELNVAASVNYWLSNGAPSNKLVLGIPTYGNTFVLSNPKQHSIGSSVDSMKTKETAGTWGYDKYCSTKSSSWKQYYDSDSRLYYALSDDSWFGFDSVRTVITKTRFARLRGLGGVMFWSLDTDDHDNVCKQGHFPLISSALFELIKK